MLSVTLLLSGVLLSLHAYSIAPYALNPYQAAGSILFWTGVLFLVGTFFLDRTIGLAYHFARTKRGAAIGGSYILVHLILYGFVLEGIVVFTYGVPPFINAPFAYVSSNLLYPATFLNAIVGTAFSPDLNILLPPVFETSLTTFSIVTAVIIDVLILANVEKVGEIGRAGSLVTKTRAYLVMPLTGIGLGATCCMSLPLILSIVDPALTDASSLIWAFYVTYFVFPVLAAVVLKLNLDLATKTAEKVAVLKSGPLRTEGTS
jgi:hypothetical protein